MDGKEFDMEHQNTEKLLRNIETIEIGNKSSNDDFSNIVKGNNITVIPPCIVLEASKSMETNHSWQTKDGTC